VTKGAPQVILALSARRSATIRLTHVCTRPRDARIVVGSRKHRSRRLARTYTYGAYAWLRL
jgi:hypothetical protein